MKIDYEQLVKNVYPDACIRKAFGTSNVYQIRKYSVTVCMIKSLEQRQSLQKFILATAYRQLGLGSEGRRGLWKKAWLQTEKEIMTELAS